MEYTRIIVSGRVHGVFYRASTRDMATRLGLVGTVRNLSDGTVEIIVAGQKIDELIRWCWEGPPAARVRNIETKKIDLDREYTSFNVVY